ncbi:MAG: hypothetical protein AB7O38_22905, partial [Pirellulaceae bacterium]
LGGESLKIPQAVEQVRGNDEHTFGMHERHAASFQRGWGGVGVWAQRPKQGARWSFARRLE